MRIPGWAKVAAYVLAGACAGVLLQWYLSNSQSYLELHGYRYNISIMRSEAELTKGLSGTQSLPDDHAMLFVFPGDNKWAIWMKDMKYPIDIVWLNSDKKVVYTIKNARPESYPSTQFRPETDARYVIELPSGTIERTGIMQGDPAGLPSGV